ncbi:hypothetical protein BJ912DRAFT_994114 [Pholiota molesta]|nr:hypothetical protein BJ912DRAFT_994114 [Pholiota molesta]
MVPKVLLPLTKCTPEKILNMTWGKREDFWSGEEVQNERGEFLQSSFDDRDCTNMRPERHGLFGTVLLAFREHNHLVLRPDDVWIAILTQISFYVNSHVEDLRSKFVAHEGKKTLHVEVDNFSFEEIATAMVLAIHGNVVDKDLAKWILPDFSTTTTNDTIVSAGLMMALLKHYFTYEASWTCGIPSITIEGSKQDWEKILLRIDKLEELGQEPTAWAALLRPILGQFVRAIEGKENIEFWKKIVSYDDVCGGPYVSGWIATFCVWSDKGKWMGPRLPCEGHPSQYAIWARGRGMDGKSQEVRSASLHIGRLPVGFCDVELTLKYPKPKGDVKCTIVAGNVAVDVEGVTVRPAPGWFMFVQAKEVGSGDLRGALKMAKKKKMDNLIGKFTESKKGGQGDSVAGGRGLRKVTLRSILNIIFCRI